MILIDDQKVIMAGDAPKMEKELAVAAAKYLERYCEATDKSFDEAFEQLAALVYKVKDFIEEEDYQEYLFNDNDKILKKQKKLKKNETEKAKKQKKDSK